MTLALTLAGWALAGALALRCARRTRQLELVARADHELRGPVCALGLAVEALARHPELRRRAAALDAHLDRLRLGLADLAAAREGRRAAGRPTETRIDRVALAATDAWTPAARAGGGEISFEWKAGPLVAHADRARLSQALGNLLANAVEHGGERIAVVGERDGDGVRIVVRDSGGSRRSRESVARRRGRGLAIAAHAVGEARGSLAIPDPIGGLSAPPRRFARRPGSAQRDRRPGVAAARSEAAPPHSTEFRIELPAVEAPLG